jgi:hypothetical protein
MKIKALWDTPASPVEADRRFVGTYCLHHQGDHSRILSSSFSGVKTLNLI